MQRSFTWTRKLAGLVKGLQADIIAVKGDPTKDISSLRIIEWIMKGGTIVDK